jgi:dolichol-phosphate mannosyltransferase
MHLCVVSPCFNEEEGITTFYRDVRAVLDSLVGWTYTILLVDDGSSDRTLEVLNAIAAADPAVEVFSLARNFGHQIALSAGLDAAVGDAIVMMDSDLQHPPSLIPKMVEAFCSGSDIVSAVRADTVGSGVFKSSSSGLFYRLINLLSDVHVVPGAADFCLLSQRAHRALLSMPERHRFLRGMVSWIGFNRTFLTFEAPARRLGTSKYTLRKMLKLALDGVFSFSAMPIRLATRFGLAVSGVGFLYLAYILARFVFVGDLIEGWASSLATLLILGGVQLTFLGILGEYVARIYEESKGRPLYFLKQAPHRLVERGEGEASFIGRRPELAQK